MKNPCGYALRVEPLRLEQHDEPLAVRRQELQAPSPAELRHQVKEAARAGFSTPKLARMHARRHGPTVGTGADETAYTRLLADIQQQPERLFSSYYQTKTRPFTLQWVFTRDTLLVIVGVFAVRPVVTTFYRATMVRGGRATQRACVAPSS